MAFDTTDLYIRPEDGWVLVATNPAYLMIKPENFHPWWVAVTAAGAPAAGVIGASMGRDSENRLEAFEITGIAAGEVYIMVRDPIASQPINQKARFAIIADA